MKAKRQQGGRIAFRCPGCGERHSVPVDDSQGWTWNGNLERPTLHPSVLIRSGHYAPGRENKACWCTYNKEHPEAPSGFECRICHSFVTDGSIQFLTDSTHALAGQTVPLPDWETHEELQ